MKIGAWLFALLPLLAHCRATNAVKDAELESSMDRAWYNKEGERINCTVPAEGCAASAYNVSFVDLCVGKGFQAKSCGCVAVCSERILMPEAPAKVAAVPAKTTASLCGRPDIDFIASASAATTTDAQKCLKHLVCDGDASSCRDQTKKDALRLRDLAKSSCRPEIEAKLCPRGFGATLACQDANIEFLSDLYTKAFTPAERRLRRCLREALCNDGSGACSASDLTTARKAKAALETGCSYWLASFCSLDGK